jgi:ParB/RepB/Spo0J family partition protein
MPVIKTGPNAVRASKSNDSSPKFQMLPLARLIPTPDNRRRAITQASIESLAKSMARDGVLQPVVVRPHPTRPGMWEIRAGERRWRAAKLAKLTQLPAIIRTLDDQSALSVTVAENLHRQELHPLEEAATIQQAFIRKFDPKAVASQLGKSVQYIARRASLTRLSKPWQAAVLREGSEASRLSPAHLELIARLPPETQNLLCEDDFRIVFGRGFPSVDDLRRLLDGALHSLRAMPWKPDDDTLDPRAGACTMCPKRSGQQPLLFDAEEGGANDAAPAGRVSKSDRCLDPTCYDNKLAAHLVCCEATLRRSHPKLQLVQVTYDRLSPSTTKAFGDRVQRTSQTMSIKAKGRLNVPVMPLDGPKAGRLMFVQSTEASPNGVRDGRQQAKAPKSAAATAAERTARLQHRREAYVVKHVESSLKAMTDGDLTKIAVRLAGKDQPKGTPPFDALALVLAFGTTTRQDRHSDSEAWPTYDRLRTQVEISQAVKALREILPIWSRRLSGVDGSTATVQAADAKRMCTLLGIDCEALAREATHAIPTPKSWAVGK